MENAVAVRKFSVSAIVATIAVLLALVAGVLGGYWLKTQSLPTSSGSMSTTSGASGASHAAVERAESDSALESDFAAAFVKHAQSERAEAGR